MPESIEEDLVGEDSLNEISQYISKGSPRNFQSFDKTALSTQSFSSRKRSHDKSPKMREEDLESYFKFMEVF